MEIVNSSILNDETISNGSKIISDKLNKIKNLKGKFTSFQFSSSSSIKNKNAENSSFFKGSSSQKKRLTFILSENEANSNSNFEQISKINKDISINKIDLHQNNNVNNENNNEYDSHSNNDDIKIIKTKFSNQSELKISLAVLRGKRLYKKDLKENKNVEAVRTSKTSQINSSDININMNFISSETGNLEFGKFFKKPLSFRLSEFEDKKRIYNNQNEEEKKNVDYKRFFDIDFDEASFHKDKKNENNKRPITMSNKNDYFLQENSSTTYLSNKNLNLDFKKNKNINKILKNNFQANSNDIEKVKLINDEEDLVKKYVLPELTTEEKEKQLKYNIDDNSDKVVIHKGNGVFLCDLLKTSNQTLAKNTYSKNGFPKILSPQNPFDPKNFAVNVDDVKFGMKPKFLVKSCGFVRYGENNKNLEQEHKYQEDNAESDSDKRINFHNTFHLIKKNNLSNFNLNNIKHDKREKNFFQKSFSINNNKNTIFSSNSIFNRLDIKNENGENLEENSNKIISKNSLSEFSLNPYNLKKFEISENKLNTKLNKIPNIENYNHKKNCDYKNNLQKFSKTNIVFHNYNKNNNFSSEAFTNEDFFKNKNFSSTDYANEDFYKNKFYGTAYASEKASENNAKRSSFYETKKNFRKIYLEYPNLKFPIQPYRKLDVKSKEKSDSNVNVSIINEIAVLNNIKSMNKNIAKRHKNERVSRVSNALSENMDKLSIIQNKIGNIIGKASEKMQRKMDKHNINSVNNSSISIK